MFFLFLVSYLLFVILFLPTLYKKFRVRVLIKNINFLENLFFSADAFISSVLFVDLIRSMSVNLLILRYGFFFTNTHKVFLYCLFDSFDSAISNNVDFTRLSKIITVNQAVCGSVFFTNYKI